MTARSTVMIAVLLAVGGLGVLALTWGGSGGEEVGGVDRATTTSQTRDTSGATTSVESTVQPAAIAAPLRVLATQGPSDDANRYVLVTWDHTGRDSTAYEVEVDGALVATVPIDDQPWNDTMWRHIAPERGERSYRVRVVSDLGRGAWSDPALVTVRGTEDIGPLFRVDDFGGTDRQAAQQAVEAAAGAGGGVVLFAARTYILDDPLVIRGNGVVLRGSGQEDTILKVGFSGGDNSCGAVKPLVQFRGEMTEHTVSLAELTPRGSTELRFDGPVPARVGEIVSVDGVTGQFPTRANADRGTAQDPGTPRDHRYPFDNGVVVAVTDDTITLDHPLSPDITPGAALRTYELGIGNGIESMTLEGLGPEDTSYHRLVHVKDQVRFRLADVTTRWANRNFIDASGHDLSFVGLVGIDGGAGGYTFEACKYKVGFGPATDIVFVGGELGSSEHNQNMSLMTIQFVYRAVVRNSTFGESRTYGFNEHGGGSRDVVFENNAVASGPDSWAGILLGNDTWGFGGETTIRNNRFTDNVVDILMVENPYGISIVGNRSSGCLEACIKWSGWGGEIDGYRPIPTETLWGSARLLVAHNQMINAEVGLLLGADESVGYRWLGARDVVVMANQVEAVTALQLLGGSDVTGRVWVGVNQFHGEIKTAEPGADWFWWDNTGGPETGSAPLPGWADEYREWER